MCSIGRLKLACVLFARNATGLMRISQDMAELLKFGVSITLVKHIMIHYIHYNMSVYDVTHHDMLSHTHDSWHHDKRDTI